MLHGHNHLYDLKNLFLAHPKYFVRQNNGRGLLHSEN